jgi:hypothetical protein
VLILEKYATTLNQHKCQESRLLLDGDRILRKPQRHRTVLGDPKTKKEKKWKKSFSFCFMVTCGIPMDES